MISNFGILNITHVGHKRFHKPVLSSLRATNPKMLVCSYNTNGGYLGWPTLVPILPDNDTMALVDKWIIHAVDKSGSSWGELNLSGISLLSAYGIDYVFATEGDCIITKPEGLETLYRRLIEEEGDIICAEKLGEKGANTSSYFAKTEVMLAIMKSYIAHEKDENLLQCAPEGHFGAAMYRLKINCLEVKPPENGHFSYGYKGTWGEVLGFMHLHGAEKWRMGHHHKPLPKEFYDIRHIPSNELMALEKYWVTGSTEHLVKDGYWWPIKIDNNEKELGDI